MRQRDVATQRDRQAATDRRALHHREGRLGQPVERQQHLDQLRPGLTFGGGQLLIGTMPPDIGADTEMLARSAQHDHTDIVVIVERAQLGHQLAQHHVVIGVAAIRTVQR